MAENLCVKMGGGNGKGTKIWENPNPSASITSNIDIAIDWASVQHVYADLIYASNSNYPTEYHELQSDLTYANKNKTMTISRAEPNTAGDLTVAYRIYQINSNGLRITGTAGYTNARSSDYGSNAVFCIPQAIYVK